MLELSAKSESPSTSEACREGVLLDGKYRLERVLGDGGMAIVWRAHNELLELPVALKVMRPELRGSEAAARFRTEARVQAKLRHPNVVRVFDYGETPGGDAFIVMELLEGSTLADWLETRGAFTPEGAVQVMLPVIGALCAAHRAGVIHRDLKPDNIFLVEGGAHPRPKLLDFGIAKLEHEPEPRLTNPGGLLGSPAYMAPEQARGLHDVDQRADVWAACVVLYECLTGKPAYDAPNYRSLLRAVIEQDLPPLEAPSMRGLWPIVRAGLMRDREARTGTMRELGEALAGWLAARRGAPQGHLLRGVQHAQAPHQPAAAPAEIGAWLSWWRASGCSQVLRLGVGASLGAGMLLLGLGPAGHESQVEEVRLVASPASVIVASSSPRRALPPTAAPRVVREPEAPPAPPEPPARAPAPPRADPPLVAARPVAAPKPVLSIKRRVPASEAELGLKNPW